MSARDIALNAYEQAKAAAEAQQAERDRAADLGEYLQKRERRGR